MKIVAFAGMPFSGKSEAVEMAHDLGILVIRMGDMVWDEVKQQGLPLTDKNVGRIADQMRQQYGMDIWARRALKKMKTVDNPSCIVIDGIRNVEEINRFKDELGEDFTVIAVTASDKTRQRRALKRGRVDDSTDIRDIQERDRRELQWGLGMVIASADIVISNEGNIEVFRDEVKKVLTKL
jgi:dephospho-CoA kinase